MHEAVAARAISRGPPSLGVTTGGMVASVRVYVRLWQELSAMAGVLPGLPDYSDFGRLLRMAGSCLHRIEALISAGRICLSPPLRLGPGEPEAWHNERTVRLGILPTAANPMHWMHLMAGLVAMARYELDEVVYVIAGEDPRKPDLLPASVRHCMAKRVLENLSPLFAYSAIALGSSRVGEESLFGPLALNARQRIHAFYLVGSDHYQRTCPGTGLPDTIQRLEEGLRGPADGRCAPEPLHRVSAVFLDRGGERVDVDTALDVRWISDLPLRCSSTGIREALGGRSPRGALAALPFPNPRLRAWLEHRVGGAGDVEVRDGWRGAAGGVSNGPRHGVASQRRQEGRVGGGEHAQRTSRVNEAERRGASEHSERAGEPKGAA